MSAKTLNCYSCGAAVSTDAPNCEHCGARLASISCPACFGMMFQGAKFCPHCGSPAVQWESEPTDWQCPSCRSPMLRGALRDIPLHECGKCYGLWLATATFEHICRHAEQHAAALGSAQIVGGPVPLAPVRYLRCPQCNELMHRLNFARCSGSLSMSAALMALGSTQMNCIASFTSSARVDWIDHERRRRSSFPRSGGACRRRDLVLSRSKFTTLDRLRRTICFRW